MKSNDLATRENVRAAMQKAILDNDEKGFATAIDQMMDCVAESVRQDYEDLMGEKDSAVLASRGIRQLTSEERKYYQKLGDAMRAADPKQALSGLDVVMPETVIDSVFDDLQTNHPLLSRINFMATKANIKMLVNTNGYQEAVWGELNSEIVKEVMAGFKEVDAGIFKLTAFLPVAKDTLDMGPEYLDRFIRDTLYETLATGMEGGIIRGTGNKQPIGMTRQVGDGVTVTGGVYPEKEKITVKDLSPKTVGNLLSMLAVDPNGKSRPVQDVILLVNPQDYFQKVMPATTLQSPDGTYRNNVLPYPMEIIQSISLQRGEAVFGMGSRYFGAVGVGSSKEGRIEYSDHYQFLEDKRVYIIKAYANGMAMDNNAFLHLDISGLEPAVWKVQQTAGSASSTDASLADLKIGSLKLSPDFTAQTTEYTAETTNGTNTVTATPKDAGAQVTVKVGDTEISNGTAATWADGANTVTITVTAEDGTTVKTYTATVTKS